MQSYTYDEVKLRNWIEKEKIKKFAIQLPAGLMPQSRDILEELTSYGEPLLYAEPTFGACDFPEISTIPGVDGIVQLGHARIPGVAKNPKILFLELYTTQEIKPPEKLPDNIGNRICIFTTVQYLNQLKQLACFLMDEGKNVHIPEPKNRTVYQGQVLGCDVSPATACSRLVDSYIFVGDGNFHPIGVAMLTAKPVFRCLPTGKVELVKFDREKFQKIGITKSSALGDAKNVGIIVCTKPGQRRLNLATKLKELLIKQRKNARVLFINNLSPDILNYTGFDVLISTACPRIALEDYVNYKVLLLTPQEALLSLGEIKDYEIDQFMPDHI